MIVINWWSNFKLYFILLILHYCCNFWVVYDFQQIFLSKQVNHMFILERKMNYKYWIINKTQNYIDFFLWFRPGMTEYIDKWLCLKITEPKIWLNNLSLKYYFLYSFKIFDVDWFLILFYFLYNPSVWLSECVSKWVNERELR